MPPETWKRVEELFLQAVELPPSERARFLDLACCGEDALRREVESLLAADGKQGQSVAAAVENAAALLLTGDPENLAGQRVGPYRLIREIGRGGMGSVYLAERDDDQYRKRVAVKVVKRGMDTAEVLGRFRHERQILANLDHPFIARLLDGGTTSDGRPFFVMDYVEGVAVDAFCRDRSLPVKARLLLFLRICEAVAHAHRNLVVHRDLKPGNIFVTADGTPRLLDFGVAKLLSADAEAITAMAQGLAFTPEYASPEQVRGKPVTTAADIYALGAILFELLTGERAQPIATATPLAIDRAVCEREVKKPSLIAPGIDADLDSIVLMAMRKEPERRYLSVEAMAEDVRRHLSGRPVIAREDSFSYRAGRFVRRNRAGIAAGVLFVAVLIGGATVSAIQARRAARAQMVAEQERRLALENEQAAVRSAREAQAQRASAESARALADTERRSAERRFGQVRELAGKFLLDFHDAIATLPGSTPARKMVVETGLQYYDTLVREAAGNRDLLEEIARGYDRMGDVQGNPVYANLGDSAGAIASYQKAMAIREKIVDPSPEFLRDRMNGEVRMAEMLAFKGDLKAAEPQLRKIIALGEQSPLAPARPVREALARAYSDLSSLQFRTGTYERALEPSRKLLDLWTGMAREHRDPAAEQSGIGTAHARLGDALLRLGRYDEALPHVRTAVETDEKLVAANPNNTTRLRKYYVDYTLLCLIFRNRPAMAAPGEARQAVQTTADLADRMQAADPNNSTAFFDVMAAQSMLGDWFRDNGQAEMSISHYQKALEATERFAAKRPGELLTEDSLAYAHQRLAAGYGNSGRLEESLAECRKAEEAISRAEARNPGLVQLESRRANVASTRADAYAHVKGWQEASAAYQAAADLFVDLIRRDPKNTGYEDELTEIRLRLADGYAAMERWDAAAETMQLALKNLEETASRRTLTSEEMKSREDGAARLEKWKSLAARAQ